ncbi:RGS1 [Acrasis kona]|uniref:RGS1 n=1 Tax=Acrasis kona TaxID=1008807 RepID=A0AAW2YV49_9EUKA
MLEKEYIEIPSGFLDKIVTNKGVAIGEINKRHKVLLMFLRRIGCMFCKETLKDIAEAYNSLIQFNTVPVVVHIETPTVFANFMKEFSNGDPILLNLISAYDEDFVLSKQFQIVSMSDLPVLGNLKNTFKMFKRGYEASKNGFHQNMLTSLSGPDPLRIPSLFIIENGKIVNECRQNFIGEKTDYIQVMIDPENFGEEIIPIGPITKEMFCDGVYCEMRPKAKQEEPKVEEVQIKNKSEQKYSCIPSPTAGLPEEEEAPIELKDVLNNKRRLRFFHVFAAKQHAAENVVFWQEVNGRFKKKEDDEERLRVAKNICEVFFDPESLMEINIKESSKNSVKSRLSEEGPVFDLFDGIIKEIEDHILIHLFALFTETIEFKDMVEKTKE